MDPIQILDNVKFTDSIMLAIPKYKGREVYTDSHYLFHEYDNENDVLTGYFLVRIYEANNSEKFVSLNVMKFVSQKPTDTLGDKYTGRFKIAEVPTERCEFVYSFYTTLFELIILNKDFNKFYILTGDNACRLTIEMKYDQSVIDRIKYEINENFNSPFKYDSKLAIYLNKQRARKIIEYLTAY